jgi:hypothetical protein
MSHETEDEAYARWCAEQERQRDDRQGPRATFIVIDECVVMTPEQWDEASAILARLRRER